MWSSLSSHCLPKAGMDQIKGLVMDLCEACSSVRSRKAMGKSLVIPIHCACCRRSVKSLIPSSNVIGPQPNAFRALSVIGSELALI